MLLTTKSRYAVTAIIELAGEAEKPLALLTIAQRQKISLSYLEQIFSCLKKAGIVDSVRGPGGGYFLKRPRNEITISEIIRAIGEPIKMTNCGSAEVGCKKTGTKCNSHDLWRGLEMKIYEYLDSVSLEKVLQNNKNGG